MTKVTTESYKRLLPLPDHGMQMEEHSHLEDLFPVE